jgi:transcriptional regulator with XRE-family HTH domain
MASHDQGPVVGSAILRAELVRLRRDKGLTQEEVARSLEWSPSKLIRIEGGRSGLTKVDLDALLTRYGATSASERLQALNRSARDRGWWDAYKNDFDDAYLNFIGYEAGASFIRQTAMMIPGLLQTPEYAEALAADQADPTKLNSVVALRLQRQRELAQRTDPPYQYFVLDEAVIRRHIGVRTDPAIMPNQLRAIAARAESDDRLTVRIVPFEAGEHAGLLGVFTLLEFAESLPDILYLDPGRGTIILEQESDKVSEYRDDFESLVERALSPEESTDLIRAVAEEMSK